MIKVCLIDNYDSFTYNVYHYLSEFNCKVTVLRNDKFKLNDLKNFDKIVISPGPGNPDQAGLCLEVVNKYSVSVIDKLLNCLILFSKSNVFIFSILKNF